jgi:hypothetical protein
MFNDNTNYNYKNNIEIVVSRFNEKLDWLNEYPFNEFSYTVYNKGINSDFEKTNVNKIISLPNVGRCDHTYLYHIISNYDNMKNITVFFPGSIHLPNKKGKAIDILERIKNNNYKSAIFIGEYTVNLKEKFYDFKLDNWLSSDQDNAQLYKSSTLKPSIIRPFGKWYQLHFGNLLVNHYSINSLFSIDKRDIIKFPKSRYRFLLNQLRIHNNPEVGHYIERSWSAIFHPFKFTKVFLL